MKGLILKDLYLARKHCKYVFLLLAVFAAISLIDDNAFFIVYPCFAAGIIPLTLYTLDEQSKWLQYADSLPCGRAKIVSAKYLIGLIACACTLTIFAAAQLIAQLTAKSFDLFQFEYIISVITAIYLFTPAMILPFVFKYGSARGRIMYYVVVGVFCGLVGALTANDVSFLSFQIHSPSPAAFGAVLLLISAAVYSLSWLLSIRFYQKREL